MVGDIEPITCTLAAATGIEKHQLRLTLCESLSRSHGDACGERRGEYSFEYHSGRAFHRTQVRGTSYSTAQTTKERPEERSYPEILDSVVIEVDAIGAVVWDDPIHRRVVDAG